MPIAIEDIQLHAVNIKTRMPFRYGIATLTEVPYLILAADVRVDGVVTRGLAADVLPPKWFTKVPDAPLDAELAEMAAVIRQAAALACALPAQESVFAFWEALHTRQNAWGAEQGMPPLLSGFGTSFAERAVIDAFCRAKETTFAEALRSNAFGVQLGRVHEALEGIAPDALLPVPVRSMFLRHTIGLLDPLGEDDIPGDERLDDGLPQSLEACIRHYGLRYFKIKLPATFEVAVARLKEIARIVTAQCPEFAFTLDGNEAYQDAAAFRDCWERLCADADTGEFIKRGLLVVEQPLHRDTALSDDAKEALLSWEARPPIIIDESDGAAECLPRALECGYAGASHKNCKGVFHGVANACLLEKLRREDPARPCVLTGEDLMNIGPVALLQDLAVSATLGVEHIERNGHHFVKGLSAFPEAMQAAVLDAHPDLYHRAGDFATLSVTGGRISTASVLAAPFGYGCELDLTDVNMFNAER